MCKHHHSYIWHFVEICHRHMEVQHTWWSLWNFWRPQSNLQWHFHWLLFFEELHPNLWLLQHLYWEYRHTWKYEVELLVPSTLHKMTLYQVHLICLQGSKFINLCGLKQIVWPKFQAIFFVLMNRTVLKPRMSWNFWHYFWLLISTNQFKQIKL